jgi:hypothetical protein
VPSLTTDAATAVWHWERQAAQADRTYGAVLGDGHLSERCYQVNRAAFHAAAAYVDTDPDLTHDALHAAFAQAGLEVHPSTRPHRHLIGALFASLTIDQATTLADTAAAFAAGDPNAIALIGAHLAGDDPTSLPEHGQTTRPATTGQPTGQPATQPATAA